jgi:holo-[acyl-carrier protein] synthase
MILGLGVDLCSISRMERAARSDYFVRRLFRPSEIAYAEGKGAKGRAGAYASAFAAREAFAKAGGVSIYRLALASGICLERTEEGPRLAVPPEVDAAFERGEKKAWVSLSHDGDFAVAVVVIELIKNSK